MMSYDVLKIIFTVLLCLPVIFAGVAFFGMLKQDEKELSEFDKKKKAAALAKKRADEEELRRYKEFEKSYGRRRHGRE